MIEADITITTNAKWSIPFIFTDDATGAAYDFTGDTFKMDVKTSSDAASAELSLTTANGGIASTDLDAGYITIIIDKADLAVGSYVYDLIRVTGGDDEYLMGGTLTVNKGITA